MTEEIQRDTLEKIKNIFTPSQSATLDVKEVDTLLNVLQSSQVGDYSEEQKQLWKEKFFAIKDVVKFAETGDIIGLLEFLKNTEIGKSVVQKLFSDVMMYGDISERLSIHSMVGEYIKHTAWNQSLNVLLDDYLRTENTPTDLEQGVRTAEWILSRYMYDRQVISEKVLRQFQAVIPHIEKVYGQHKETIDAFVNAYRQKKSQGQSTQQLEEDIVTQLKDDEWIKVLEKILWPDGNAPISYRHILLIHRLVLERDDFW
jgi:hypothetical protein